MISSNLPPILHRFRDIAFGRSKIAIFGYPLVFNSPDGGVPLGRAPYIFLSMSKDGQGTKCRRKIAENFSRLSRVQERYRQTGRQTSRQTTDRRTDGRQHIANVNVRYKLECGPMHNVIAALPNIGGASVERRKIWLTPTTRVPWSNAAKTRKPLKFAGVPQTRQQISAASGSKLTIL